MKQGQTYHEFNCTCDFCKAGDTRYPVTSPEEMDVLDGPEQKCYPIEQAHHITDPSHGGKVTCHKCNGFVIAAEGTGYLDHQHRNDFPNIWFHNKCYNPYEHYYGLDKPID